MIGVRPVDEAMITFDASLHDERSAIDGPLPADRLKAGPAVVYVPRGGRPDLEARLVEGPRLPCARGRHIAE